MSENPGFGGQTFIETSLKKIQALKELRQKENYSYLIEVDGGINGEIAKLCKASGADIVVAGSYIFNHQDKLAAIHSLK